MPLIAKSPIRRPDGTIKAFIRYPRWALTYPTMRAIEMLLQGADMEAIDAFIVDATTDRSPSTEELGITLGPDLAVRHYGQPVMWMTPEGSLEVVCRVDQAWGVVCVIDFAHACLADACRSHGEYRDEVPERGVPFTLASAEALRTYRASGARHPRTRRVKEAPPSPRPLGLSTEEVIARLMGEMSP